MPFCTRCGAQVSDAAFYCPNCGEGISRQSGGPPRPYVLVVTQSPLPEDRSALSSIQKYAIMSLVNFAAAAAIYVYFLAQFLLLFAPSQTSSATFVQEIFLVFVALFVGGAIVAVLSLYFLRAAFESLRRVSDEFGTPSKLTFVALVALPALFMLLIFFFGSIISSLTQGSSGAAPLFPPGSLVGVSSLLVVFSISAAVGEIGGVLLGLWRVGARYDEGLFKAAVICSIIPFLGIIAPILELIGVHQVRKKWP